MKLAAVEQRYARALATLAAEQGQLEEVWRQLRNVAAALAVEPRLGPLLESPTLAKDKKTALLAGLADHLRLDKLLRKFLGLLQERGRVGQFPGILRHYREQADGLLQLVRVQVESAVPLDPQQQAKLQALVEQQTGRRVVLEFETVPELVGGLRVRVGSRIMDCSVVGRLERLAAQVGRG